MSKLIRSSVLLLLMSFALEACGEDKQTAAAKTTPTAVPAKANEPAKTATTTNQVVTEAKQKKINSDCMDRVTNMSGFLIGGGQYSSTTYAASKDADESLFSAAIGHKGKDGNHLAFMNVSPDDNCSATYEVVKVWTNNCQQVATNAFAQYKFKGRMVNGASLFEMGPNAHIYAMPTAGQGCVTVQKNVVFEPVK